jgi:methionyl-tRNA formyltransferase
MKVVFMGTPDFAVASLDAIHKSNHNVVGVVTATDKPAGRGKKISSSAVKKYAVENELKILQPENLKEDLFKEQLIKLKADVFIVVAFRMLPKKVWEIPTNGTINLHGSLLPQYRGAAPINWAIINGEKSSGVTTFLIDEKIDTGNILLQEKVTINEGDNAGNLHDKLMNIGSLLIIKTINNIENKSIVSKAQEVKITELKTAFKLNKTNTKINWNSSSKKIRQLILGLSPYPTAWTKLVNNEKQLNFKLFEATISNKKLNPGEIEVEKDQLFVGTSDLAIELKEVQLEGKKRMKASSFINGNTYIKDSTIV